MKTSRIILLGLFLVAAFLSFGIAYKPNKPYHTANQLPNPRIPLCETKEPIVVYQLKSAFGKKMAYYDISTWDSKRPIRICFLDGDDDLKSKVAIVANEWTKYANIKFQFTDKPAASDVRVTLLQGGYKSVVGTAALKVQKPRPTMWLGRIDTVVNLIEFRGIILHEFGHMLGLIHEHKRADAPIVWNEPAVYKYYIDTLKWTAEDVKLNIFDRIEMDLLNASVYDPFSIMHYPVPEHFTQNHFSVGWNNELTETDKAHIGLAYP